MEVGEGAVHDEDEVDHPVHADFHRQEAKDPDDVLFREPDAVKPADIDRDDALIHEEQDGCQPEEQEKRHPVMAEDEDDGCNNHGERIQRADDELIDQFYDKVIENYDYTGNYLILLIHDTYDVPGKTTDGLTMDDASDEIYEYIMCCICHVNLSKAGLSYFDSENTFHNRIRDWIVDVPDIGFLFPAFIDRTADIHNVLYYTKKPEEIHEEFIRYILGTGMPVTAGNQKEAFQTIITDTLGMDCDYEVIRNIHENLNEMIEEQKDSPEPLTLSRNSLKNLLETSGVSEEKLQTFDANFDRAAAASVNQRPVAEGSEETLPAPAPGKVQLYANNIASTKSFEVKTPEVVIKVNPDRADLVETREIDGRKCIVIEITDEVSVNGIPVKY